MAKKESVMLAHQFKNQSPAGMYMSEKLDGMRVLWLPFTKGMKKKDVPFANNDKDGRLKEEEICSGLWSRYMNVIHAPEVWTSFLPNVCLDGELYSENLPREDLMSIVKKKNHRVNQDDWLQDVFLYCFDMPHIPTMFAGGEITGAQFNKNYGDLSGFLQPHLSNLDYHPSRPQPFSTVLKLLTKHCNHRAKAHEQELLPLSKELADRILMEELTRITDSDGEGLMLRDPFSTWQPVRSKSLLKVKKLHDMEATVVGYRTGKRTEKGSRHLGRMGSLIVVLESGIEFELSGFTDSERELHCTDARQWAENNPGEVLPTSFENPSFPVGSEVTFRYRGFTKIGVPVEARYWRRG